VKQPVLGLVGPTASGKTGLAVKLAESYPIEIISMDSALVYRDMNIGTAKPDAEILRRVPHHLIDLIDPTQRYSAAQFRQDALEAIQDIHSRGRTPLLVGGTMLYFKVLVEGLDDLPRADEHLRQRIEEEAQERGWLALHEELLQHDPAAAARIEPTDTQRIQRALEVLRTTGRPISSFWQGNNPAVLPYRRRVLALVPSNRAKLHERIELRFDQMLKDGLVDELVELRANYPLSSGLPSMRCVGYRQIWAYLEGAYDQTEMRDRGVYATRQLAKRQLTWLRGMQLKSVDCFDENLDGKLKNWADQSLA
jgi:tRNA dimethylallyltransferase